MPPQNHRRHILHPGSRHLCLEIQRAAPVPTMYHVAPWYRRRVRRLLVGEADDLIKIVYL